MNKRITKMNVDTLKRFRNNELTEKKIIQDIITEVGGDLYQYMLFLENTDKSVEADVLANYRTLIFEARTKHNTNVFSAEDVKEVMDKIYDLLNIQIMMLRQIPGRQWEVGFLSTFMNELADFKYQLKPNKAD